MKIGNEERPYRFGMNVFILYCELNKCSITDMGDDISKMIKMQGTGAEVRDLCWASLKDGARKEKIEFEHSAEDVGDWLDEIDQDDLSEWFNYLGKHMEERIPDDVKSSVKKKAS